jgi:ketosteroid isomerase-like protein
MMKPHETTIPEQLLMQFCDGYKKRDLPLLLSLFTKKATLWGTGVDEYREGLEQIEEQILRDWHQSDSGEIHVVSFISTPHNALWTAAICETTIVVAGKTYHFEDLRGTIVITQEEGIWKIVHMHASFPDYRNSEANSFPIQEN